MKTLNFRRSERLKTKHLSANLADNVPSNYLEVINSMNLQDWQIAIKYELDFLIKYDVWEIVVIPEKTKLIKNKWVYTLKEGVNKEIKYRVRLVAVRFNQIKSKNYSGSYSPVVNIE